MTTIYDLLGTRSVTEGQSLVGGIRLFGSYRQCVQGKIIKINENYLGLSGTYDIDEAIGEYKICGKGNFNVSLSIDSNGNWQAEGSLTGSYLEHGVIHDMVCSVDEDYHVFTGKSGELDIVLKTWNEIVEGKRTVFIYAEISSKTVILPSVYISFC